MPNYHSQVGGDYAVMETVHQDINASDAIIATYDPDCVGIYFHENQQGELTCYEVWTLAVHDLKPEEL